MSSLAETSGLEDSLERLHKDKDGSIVCNVCDYAAQQEAIVIMHIKYVHNKDKIRKCSLWDDSTDCEEDLESCVHKRTRQYKCIQCDHLTFEKHELLRHVKSGPQVYSVQLFNRA
jgi:hypothetical protein